MVQLFCTTYISLDHAHQEIIRAKVGKGGISDDIRLLLPPWRFDWKN